MRAKSVALLAVLPLAVAALSGCAVTQRPKAEHAATACTPGSAVVEWGASAATAKPVAVNVRIEDTTGGTVRAASIPLQASAHVEFGAGRIPGGSGMAEKGRWADSLLSRVVKSGRVPTDFGQPIAAPATGDPSSRKNAKLLIADEVSTVSVPFRVRCGGTTEFAGTVEGPVSDGIRSTITVTCGQVAGSNDSPEVTVALGLTGQFCADA